MNFSKFRDFLAFLPPLKANIPKSSKIVLQYSNLVYSCVTFLHWSNQEPNYVRKKSRFFRNFAIFFPIIFKNSKIAKCFFFPLSYFQYSSLVSSSEISSPQSNLKLSCIQKSEFFKFSDFFSLIQKFQNRRKGFFNILVPPCNSSLPWSNLEPNCALKSEFFEIYRFFPLSPPPF